VPVVIEGMLPQADHRWELHSFVEMFDPAATYSCRVHGGDKFATTPSLWKGKSHARHVVMTTPRKFADTITSGVGAREDCYVQSDVQGTAAGGVIAAHLDRLSQATGLEVHRRYGPMANMWWGAAGHTEPLHMDATDGTLCQLRGRKRVVLFPPERWVRRRPLLETRGARRGWLRTAGACPQVDLAPFPATDSGMSWAFAQVCGSKVESRNASAPVVRGASTSLIWQVEQSKPDFVKFPRLRRALEDRMVTMLEEGEVLFIPCCAAHEITGEPLRAGGEPTDHVLSFNRFWRTDPALVRPHMPAESLAAYNRDMAVHE
jgi:hypothetical protein